MASLNGQKFEQTLRSDKEQESLMFCSPWVVKSEKQQKVRHNLATEQEQI